MCSDYKIGAFSNSISEPFHALIQLKVNYFRKQSFGKNKDFSAFKKKSAIWRVLEANHSHLELWVTIFLPDRQPPLIFVRFISNFLCMCSYFEVNETKIKGGCQSGRKVMPHDSKSDKVKDYRL